VGVGVEAPRHHQHPPGVDLVAIAGLFDDSAVLDGDLHLLAEDPISRIVDDPALNYHR